MGSAQCQETLLRLQSWSFRVECRFRSEAKSWRGLHSAWPVERLEVRRLTSDAGCLWTWSEVPHFFVAIFSCSFRCCGRHVHKNVLTFRACGCALGRCSPGLVFSMSIECCRSQRCVSRSPQVWHSTFFRVLAPVLTLSAMPGDFS